MNPYIEEVSGKCDAHSLYLKKAHRLTPDYVQPHLIEKGREAQALADYLVQGGQNGDALQAVVAALPTCKTLLDAAALFETASLQLMEGTVPSHQSFDNADGTFTTRQPGPQSTLLKVTSNDFMETVWRDDAAPTETGLMWDGQGVTVHLGSNAADFIPLFAQSRDGSAHTATMSFSGFAGLAVEMRSAEYLESELVSFFGFPPYAESLIVKAMRTIDAARRFITRTKANKQNPAWLVKEVTNIAVPGTGNQMFGADIYVPKGTAAGSIAGTLTLTDELGGTIDVACTIVVRGVELTDQNAKPNMLYLPKDLGERVNANQFPAVPSDAHTLHQDYLDEAFRVARKHGFDPVSGDPKESPSTLPTPVPDARQLARLDGSIYAGGQYRGASAHSWDVVGFYNDLLGWPGVSLSNDDATNTTAAASLLSQRNTTLASSGITLDATFGYTNDEGAFSEAEKRAVWLDKASTGVKPLATFSTTTGHLIEEAFTQAPTLEAYCGSGHVVPTNAKPLWDAQRAAGKFVGWYNGIRGARGSMMMEEDPRTQSLSFVMDAKVGNNIWFQWNGCYVYGVEITDVSGAPAGQFTPTSGPAPGVRDSRRQNFFKYAVTFGNWLVGEDDTFNRGDGQTRLSQLDGVFMRPRTDAYYSSDAPGDFGFDERTALKAFRNGIQDEVIIAMARAKDATATDALVNAFYPNDPFVVGAGANGTGTVENNDRSYISGPNAKTFQDDISGNAYIEFRRALYDILEA